MCSGRTFLFFLHFIQRSPLFSGAEIRLLIESFFRTNTRGNKAKQRSKRKKKFVPKARILYFCYFCTYNEPNSSSDKINSAKKISKFEEFDFLPIFKRGMLNCKESISFCCSQVSSQNEHDK